MNTLKSLLSLSLLVILSVSCSSEDKDPAVVFTALTANKTDLFIEDAVTINLEGTGYTEANLFTSNTKIKINKITSSVFEITSSQATTATITAELKNNSNNQTKSVTINFAEHGVKNFKIVEGITVDVDKSGKLINLLGQPDYKVSIPDSNNIEAWLYLSKGLDVYISKTTNIITQIDVKSFYYYYTNSENIKTPYTTYPYEIGNGWKLNNSATTMDAVINKLNAPSIKTSSNTPPISNIGYQYLTERLYFRFYSDSEDNYTGKKIIYFSIY
ncbi:hypothetical protein SLW70_13745 [Flavobacterium sp. NG2]|uniref:hypothetical protein n=1 Tax=Flavobacterium sp. NG2 TaxID=3097547 RepID=UPI002A82DE29|nr:hypothetical protein [Flavobacterium sp. NG2]WPR70986.1 hypothetical protein SLW70_13745 [Flavobacterium sp. NG2]